MYDVVCFSHLRWQFVYQRPQHLLTRCGKIRRVFFVEEPLYDDGDPRLDCHVAAPGVEVLTPILPHGTSGTNAERIQAALVRRALFERGSRGYVLWFYTPMALPLAHELEPAAVVYDCMDELSAFKGANLEMVRLERELLRAADVVFTGGHALYEAKRSQHSNIHAFPSSVDVAHFAAGRRTHEEPLDQAAIPHPRFGFCGVIDERMDLALLDGVACERPDYNFVLIGPIAKIEKDDLPIRPNIHYLGPKSYAELPAYIGAWNVGIMPFAKNAATEFISPTKTPEYLAAGIPVVSTSIKDVVRTYATRGLCRVADTPAAFAFECSFALAEQHSKLRLLRVDAFLASMSWDETWTRMSSLVDAAVAEKRRHVTPSLRSDGSGESAARPAADSRVAEEA